jgi:hypothetical protein
MTELKQVNAYALECLRLEADCRELAWNVRSPRLQSHFIRMARTWSALAASGPDSQAFEAASDAWTVVK